MTLLADRQYENARSQAPAWERTVLEAPPPVSLEFRTIRQAEPGNQLLAISEKRRIIAFLKGATRSIAIFDDESLLLVCAFAFPALKNAVRLAEA